MIQLKKNLIFFLFLLINLSLSAQKTSINYPKKADFENAKRLYNNKSYAAAQLLFTKVSKANSKYKNVKIDADYYDAICAIKLNHENANDKVLAFAKNYPHNNKKDRIFLTVGNHYFANRKAAHALRWYKKVNVKLLSEEEKNELNYKMGYALLASNYLKDAKEKFKTLLGNPSYGNDARYYYGYIAYKQENFGEAEDNLSQLANDATYQSKANYYVLDISFKAGRFDKSVQIGKKLLETSEDKKEKSEISKIIGESYFNLKKYKEAIPYLMKYKGKKGRFTNTDFYYLGYAYYKQKDYEKATNYFNKIIGSTNKVAQNAYYHLAECYLKLDKKIEALNAFKNASEMDFDAKISENAALHYAKLSYEEGNPYKSVPEVLQAFLQKYPNSPNKKEVSDLLITSYLHQGDYAGALTYLNANKSPENEDLTNEVSLYRGIQLFNEQKLTEAIPFFFKATKTQDKKVSNKATFWLGETNYLLGKYEEALNSFLLITDKDFEEAKTLDYQIAYSYFKQKKYEQAANHFQKFLDDKIDNVDLNDDASNRLGDSFYATKQYDKAIKSYDKVIQEGGVGSDYAVYQTAMSYGLSGNKDEKINQLSTLIADYETSQLKDDALFQLATTHTAKGNVNKAQNTYNTLLKNHTKSSYIPNVLLRQGLLYYNNDNSEKALTKYKEVVSKFPNSKEAKQAVTNVKNVYIDLGRVDEYATWVKGVKFINVSDADLDNATYESAENQFLENNTQKAITGFKKYLKAFPNGINALKANFYLAQSYYNNKQYNEATPHYKYVVDQEKSEYSEESLAKLTKLYLEKEDWTKAMVLLQRLEVEANYPQNVVFAQSNLMKGFYEKENYVKAVEYAEKVLANGKIDANVSQDAKVILARSAIKTKDFTTAEDYYMEISKNASGKIKAESLYYNAMFAHENEFYEDSNTIIQDLIANYSNYKYWGVKSYIIMAKNFYALKDAYQATYILENIIKNFTQFKDVIEEANNELRNIKNKEAKTNESINTQN